MHRLGRKSAPGIKFKNYKFIFYAFCLFGLLLIIFMFRWQVIQHDLWSAKAQNQYRSLSRAPKSRGVIYSSDGAILAIDEPAWNVYASLSSKESERKLFFSKKDLYITQIANILQIDPDSLRQKLTDDFRYVNIASGISDEQKKALEEAEIFTREDMQKADLPGGLATSFGLYFEKVEKRVYPDGRLASHVIGFMGKNDQGEDIGQYGIEGYYFGDLIGYDITTTSEKDAFGNPILTVGYDPIRTRPGKSITLTIHSGLQSKVETVLKESVEKYKAKNGSVIIMDPQTGAILALANYPDYDPNEYAQAGSSWIYRNKAISDLYEPGSIQKPITTSIALESGKVKEDWICHDTTGYIELYEYKIWTWNRKPSGNITLSEILEQSNNPCTAQLAIMTGFDYYYPKLLEFGYGSLIGLGLQDEVATHLMPYNNWSRLDLATSAFGQGISITPLQILSATSAIANDGKRMKPYIVQKIEDDEETINYDPIILSEPISKETADKVTQMMVDTVQYGAQHRVFSSILGQNYKLDNIAGKTGTAQIAKKGEVGYDSSKTNMSFIGFAPADNPKMAMIVILNEPEVGRYAYESVVPTWAELYKATRSHFIE